MEIYSKERKCKKCGSMGTADLFRVPNSQSVEEVIRRKCLNCSFQWSEKPLA